MPWPDAQLREDLSPRIAVIPPQPAQQRHGLGTRDRVIAVIARDRKTVATGPWLKPAISLLVIRTRGLRHKNSRIPRRLHYTVSLRLRPSFL